MPDFQSTHSLDFLSRRWDNPFNIEGYQEFKIGTCIGQWIAREKTYDILTVINDVPGNGHFQDVLDWFENSCRRDNKDLRILEVMNPGFRDHLLKKRGFIFHTTDDVIKLFRK